MISNIALPYQAGTVKIYPTHTPVEFAMLSGGQSLVLRKVVGNAKFLNASSVLVHFSVPVRGFERFVSVRAYIRDLQAGGGLGYVPGDADAAARRTL